MGERWNRFRRAAWFSACLVAIALAPALAADGAENPGPPAASFTDPTGFRVTLIGQPVRIVSLAPSVTEILSAIGAGGRLAGVSDFCRPPSGTNPARVGGIASPDLERIVSLKPDLVIATTSGNYLDDRDRLARLGIPVYTCDTPDVASVPAAIEALGQLTGESERAVAIAASFRARLDAVARRVSGRTPPRVLFVVWGEPLLAPGKGAFITDALQRAGASSITENLASRWGEIDLEHVLSARPDVILTVPDNAAFARALPSRSGWEGVPAVKAGRIHIVGDAIQQPGPRLIEAIEEIAGLLHPVHPGDPGAGSGRP